MRRSEFLRLSASACGLSLLSTTGSARALQLQRQLQRQLEFQPAASDTLDNQEVAVDAQMLDQVANVATEDYNPDYVIQAVNALLPLGKDAALDTIATYARDNPSAGDGSGLFWVLRVLFEVPPDPGYPPVQLGAPSIPPPADATGIPRFPIVMVSDVPFLAIRGFDLGGLPESVDVHIDYYRANGSPRDQAIQSPATLDGLDVAFLEAWRSGYGDAFADAATSTVREQLTRMEATRVGA